MLAGRLRLARQPVALANDIDDVAGPPVLHFFRVGHALAQASPSTPLVQWEELVDHGILSLLDREAGRAFADSYLAPLGTGRSPRPELVETLLPQDAAQNEFLLDAAFGPTSKHWFNHLLASQGYTVMISDYVRFFRNEGNGRFVRNLVERSEEEREYRLDHSDAEDFTDDELMTITDDDVRRSAVPLLRGLGVFVKIMTEDGRLAEIGNPPVRVETYGK